MEYWISENKGNLTYSIDMIRLDFVLKDSVLNSLLSWFNDPSKIDIDTYGLNTSPFKFRHMFRINYAKSSLIVGLGFNGISSSDSLKCFMEFNPNKVFQTIGAIEDVYFILDKALKVRVSRWDLAIDIPLRRELLQLVKDNRKYSLTMKSESDKTEYLGTRNSGGFVKLYNKTIESKLDKDMTRLEITCDKLMTIDDIVEKIPQIRGFEYQRELTLDNALSEKDRLLVDLLKMHPDMFMRLNDRNRKKFKPYVFGDSVNLKFDRYCIRLLKERVFQFEK